jgi:hypothetical protein
MSKNQDSSRQVGAMPTPSSFSRLFKSLHSDLDAMPAPRSASRIFKSLQSNVGGFGMGGYGMGGYGMGGYGMGGYGMGGYGMGESLWGVADQQYGFHTNTPVTSDFEFLSADLNVQYWSMELCQSIERQAGVSYVESKTHLRYHRESTLALLKPYLTEETGYALSEEQLADLTWTILANFALFSVDELNFLKERNTSLREGIFFGKPEVPFEL